LKLRLLVKAVEYRMGNGILVYSQLFQFVIYTTGVIACMGFPCICLYVPGIGAAGRFGTPMIIFSYWGSIFGPWRASSYNFTRLRCFDFGKHECAGFQHLPGQLYNSVVMPWGAYHATVPWMFSWGSLRSS